MRRIIAVNSNCYHHHAIEDAIIGIRDAGFHYIELTATKGWTEHVFPTMSFSSLCAVQDRLKDARLTPIAMSGHTNLMDAGRAADFMANMRLAAFFGCDTIVSSIGEAHLANQRVAGDEVVAGRIRGLLPNLEEYGLTLALENHGEHGAGKRMAEIADLVDSPRVVVNYDTGNAIFYADADLAEDIDACIDRIGFMHIKDKAGGAREWNFPAPGAGCVDFPMIFEKLRQAGNGCPLSIEIEFVPGGGRDLAEVNEAVREAYRYMKGVGMEV